VIDKQKLKLLWFIYGDCYAASQEYYERIKNQISRGINEIPGVYFSETKELGRVNKVDPLGITHLRIRGMWGIENPLKVFDYLNLGECSNTSFKLIAILKESKYLSLPKASISILESLSASKTNLKISTQSIKCPDNPAVLLPAKIITYNLILILRSLIVGYLLENVLEYKLFLMILFLNIVILLTAIKW
jgi:hypothetical protein